METDQRVREFVTSNFFVSDAASLTDSASLLDLGVVDSTGVLEIIGFLEYFVAEYLGGHYEYGRVRIYADVTGKYAYLVFECFLEVAKFLV